MSKRSRTIRIAAAAMVAALSIIGVSDAGGAPGAVMADRHWCC